MYWIIGYILCIEVNEESCKANNNKNHPSFTAGRRTCGFVQLFGWNCPAEQLGGNIQIVWKRLGLPHGKYSKFQMAPVVLWQGPAGPCSQGGGTSMETCWRMDEKCFRGSEEWRKKKKPVRINFVNTKAREGGVGGGVPGAYWSNSHTSACGGAHTGAMGIPWRNCSLWKTHTGRGLLGGLEGL